MRHKARKVLEDLNGTGGGPSKSLSLTNVEERAVALWGRVAIDGIKNATIIGLPFTAPQETNNEDIEIVDTENTAHKENVTPIKPSTNFIKRKRGSLLICHF